MVRQGLAQDATCPSDKVATCPSIKYHDLKPPHHEVNRPGCAAAGFESKYVAEKDAVYSSSDGSIPQPKRFGWAVERYNKTRPAGADPISEDEVLKIDINKDFKNTRTDPVTKQICACNEDHVCMPYCSGSGRRGEERVGEHGRVRCNAMTGKWESYTPPRRHVRQRQVQHRHMQHRHVRHWHGHRARHHLQHRGRPQHSSRWQSQTSLVSFGRGGELIASIPSALSVVAGVIGGMPC
jgi:hypothetical protein